MSFKSKWRSFWRRVWAFLRSIGNDVAPTDWCGAFAMFGLESLHPEESP